MTLIIAFAIDKTMGFRISSADGRAGGVDVRTHAETAYEFNDAAYGGSFTKGSGAAVKVTAPEKEGAPA